MNFGRMRDRFSIRQPHQAQNAYGEDVGKPKPVARLWGELRTLSGRQLQLAQANTITSTATHSVRMRFAAFVTVNTVLALPKVGGGQRTFRINHVDNVNNLNAEMVLTVTEVVG